MGSTYGLRRGELMRIEVYDDRIVTTLGDSDFSREIRMQLEEMLFAGRRHKARHTPDRWNWKAELFPWDQVSKLVSRYNKEQALIRSVDMSKRWAEERRLNEQEAAERRAARIRRQLEDLI